MSQTSDGKVVYTVSGKLVKHGSASSYNNHRCRCRECTDAWADYMRPRIQKRRADAKKKETATRPNVKVNF
jgi:hypothetical protein